MTDEKLPEKFGRYWVVRVLGKGAMGIVYEGRDPKLGRRVAIKTARRDVIEGSGRAEELMERFLREAKAAGGLNHPNIITIYDVGEEDGTAYIAMEYLEGGDVSDFLARESYAEPERAVEICVAVCDALSVAHKNKIVHRDIKPENVVMLKDGKIKVADFGIASVSDSNLTQEGSLIGTPFYMSPEQFQGKKLDGRSDLFALGVMAYELLTGEKPFTGEALSTIMTRVLKSTPSAPRELNASVSAELSAVVMKALAKDKNKRYQTADEFSAALQESLKDKPNQKVLGVSTGALESTLGQTEIHSSRTRKPTAGAGSDSGTGKSSQTGTVAGAPPPQVDLESKPARTPSPSQLANKPRSPFIPVVVGLLVAILAAGGLYFVMAEPSYASVVIEKVALCPTEEMCRLWEETGVIPPSAPFAGGAQVTIIDAITGEYLENGVVGPDGQFFKRVESGHSRLKITIVLQDYQTEKFSSLEATSDDQVLKIDEVFLIHNSIDFSNI